MLLYRQLHKMQFLLPTKKMGIITNQKGEAPKWLKPTEYFGRLRVSYYRIGRSPRDLLLMSILRMEKVKKGKIKMEIKKKASLYSCAKYAKKTLYMHFISKVFIMQICNLKSLLAYIRFNSIHFLCKI